jgi:hypothetical protein
MQLLVYEAFVHEFLDIFVGKFIKFDELKRMREKNFLFP